MKKGVVSHSSYSLVFSLGFFGLQSSLKTFFQEIIVLSVIRDSAGLVDLTLESSHRAI